ncbi:MAG TPA: hypothetical protein VHE78_15925 [Gemmatimonadaceae bacterium]|nr:hypothetical protein [Gemmatimonadaceae bacterium]
MSIGGARYRAGQGRTLTTAPLPEGGFGVELALAGSPEVERVRFFREHVPTTGVIRGVDRDLLMLTVHRYLGRPGVTWIPIPAARLTDGDTVGLQVTLAVAGGGVERFAVTAVTQAVTEHFPRRFFQQLLGAIDTPLLRDVA